MHTVTQKTDDEREQITLMTVNQLAERWNVSEGLIYKLVAARTLQCHRIGNAIRFAEEQITAYINRKAEQKPKQTFSHLDL